MALQETKMELVELTGLSMKLRFLRVLNKTSDW